MVMTGMMWSLKGWRGGGSSSRLMVVARVASRGSSVSKLIRLVRVCGFR
jgi:hypothetical protein